MNNQTIAPGHADNFDSSLTFSGVRCYIDGDAYFKGCNFENLRTESGDAVNDERGNFSHYEGEE